MSINYVDRSQRANHYTTPPPNVPESILRLAVLLCIARKYTSNIYCLYNSCTRGIAQV